MIRLAPLVAFLSSLSCFAEQPIDWDNLRLPSAGCSLPDEVLITESIRSLEGRDVKLRGFIVPVLTINVQRDAQGNVGVCIESPPNRSIPLRNANASDVRFFEMDVKCRVAAYAVRQKSLCISLHSPCPVAKAICLLAQQSLHG